MLAFILIAFVGPLYLASWVVMAYLAYLRVKYKNPDWEPRTKEEITDYIDHTMTSCYSYQGFGEYVLFSLFFGPILAPYFAIKTAIHYYFCATALHGKN